jgi:hypothetical protein
MLRCKSGLIFAEIKHPVIERIVNVKPGAQPYKAFPKSVLCPDDGHLVRLLSAISSANARRFGGAQTSAYQVPRPAP